MKIFFAFLMMSHSFLVFATNAKKIPKLYQSAVAKGAVYNILHETKYLRLSTLQEKGAQFPWQFVERIKGKKGAAFIIAITENNELILGQQRRIPVQAEVLALPGGLIGDKNSETTICETAKNELQEETGYFVDLDDLEIVNVAPSSEGLTNELHHVIFAKKAATNLQVLTLENAEKHAKLHPILIKLDEIEQKLEEKKKNGIFVDNKIYQALYYLRKFGHM